MYPFSEKTWEGGGGKKNIGRAIILPVFSSYSNVAIGQKDFPRNLISLRCKGVKKAFFSGFFFASEADKVFVL